MVVYNFKQIRPVPSANDFVDIVLSKTQRKTPTVVHQGYAIGRIRSFYMRKVKFTSETFCEKLSWILEDFPKLDDIHPFLADLCNVLYDRDHYKLALGQLNICKSLISTISKDYVRLMKYGDTLYRCKQLKRAALGRMATLMKKHKSSLGYLEEVRKHLSRMPAIDPNTRTLLITGYPNVGKSSFMNKVTRADVEVQPYAFTTKSLYVGHTDHQYLRWQVIDTPGILDKPLEERNTIEMQAITALAHLQCCVLYFLDLSEQCGWTIEQQVALFDNIRPLFANKPLVVVANKIDVTPLEALSTEHRTLIDKMVADSGALLLPMSAAADINISEVKQQACEMLLERRVEIKTKSKKLTSVLNRLTVAVPQARDKKDRPAFIPESVLAAREARAANNGTDADGDEEMGEKKKTEKDLMWENGGPGVYSCDYRKYYKLKDDDYKFDAIPEIIDGRNIADFVDPDIMEKLEALEKEEEERAARENAIIEAHENDESDLDEEEKDFVTKIRHKKKMLALKTREEKGKNRSTLFKKHQLVSRTTEEYKKGFEDVGIDASKVDPPTRGRKRERSVGPDGRASATGLARAEKAKSVAARSQSRGRSAARSRSMSRAASENNRVSRGLSTPAQQVDANKRMKRSQKKIQQFGKAGEADRKHLTAMPKHLFSGKRKGHGSQDRR